jgi:hypothetical protein
MVPLGHTLAEPHERTASFRHLGIGSAYRPGLPAIRRSLLNGHNLPLSIQKGQAFSEAANTKYFGQAQIRSLFVLSMAWTRHGRFCPPKDHPR